MNSGVRGLFGFIRALKPDGIIANAWIPGVAPPDAESFTAAFPDLPLYFLGNACLDRPYAHLEGSGYIRLLVEHLVLRHRRQRIAFLSNSVPDDRDEAYRTYLQGIGLWNERYYFAGSASWIEPVMVRIEHIVAELFDDPSLEAPDAILALGTNEAVTLIEKLKDRGIMVPKDVSVLSWEDGEAGRSCDPPITCVEYPFREIARASAEGVLALIDGKHIATETRVPARIFFRESCGCLLSETTMAKYHPDWIFMGSHKSKTPNNDEAGFFALLDADTEASASHFFMSWTTLAKNAHDEASGLALRRLLSNLRRRQRNVTPQAKAERMFERLETAQAIIDEISMREFFREDAEALKAERKLDYSSLAVLAAQKRDSVYDATASAIKELGLSSCWILIADIKGGAPPSLESYPENFAADFAYQVDLWYENGKRDTDKEGKIDNVENFLHEILHNSLHPKNILMKLLYFNERFWGLICMDLVSHDTRILESFSRFIGLALNGVEILENLFEAQHSLTSLAENDPLTGLGNRYAFYRDLRQRIKLSENGEKTKEGFALLFMDLDGFKPVNDMYGHDAGDQVLRKAADRIKSVAPEAVSGVYRLGGDEFTAIIQCSGSTNARQIAKRFLAEIKKPYLIQDTQLNVGVSIGGAQFPRDSVNPDELVRLADLSMYRAKERKGTVVFFNKRKDTPLLRQASLASDILKAVERDEIEILYQGIYDSEGTLAGVEALSRWRHPRFGLLLPDDFLHLAIAGNAIAAIETRVLDSACRELASLSQRTGQKPFLLVNCARRFFYSPSFIQTVKAAVADSGLESGILRLGLEERFAFDDPEAAFRIIAELKNSGVDFAVEGMGGNSSWLRFLRRLPPDTIVKVDRRFAERIAESQAERQFLERMLSLFGSCGLRTTVSGVETEAQLNILRQTGCFMQGYAFSMPTRFKELEPNSKR